MDIVIALGFNHNSSDSELSKVEQEVFLRSVVKSIESVGGSVNAQIVGFSDGGDYAPEPGAWLAASLPDDRARRLLKLLLSFDAYNADQESIGLTSPEGFEFVYASSTAF